MPKLYMNLGLLLVGNPNMALKTLVEENPIVLLFESCPWLLLK